MSKRIAYLAGGCFWCITPIFKIYGASKVTCGYCGNDNIIPSYELVKEQKTNYRETIAVEYDDKIISYEKLIELFLLNVDIHDKDGQFIDKGFSYTLAIYYQTEEEYEIIKNQLSKLNGPIYISIEPFNSFYPAEEYHQDYYLKHPKEFEEELINSGRKKRI